MENRSTIDNDFQVGGDLPIRRMGYGAMRITGKGIWGPPADKAEAIRVLQRAVDLGINFIDTADSYGPYVSETLIGETLYPYPEGLVIATKGGFERTGPNEWHVNGDPKHLRKALEGSLKRLRLESIPLYQLHRIDTKVSFDSMFTFLARAQEEGLIQHFGLSEVSVKDIEAAQAYVQVVSVQNKYSLDFRKWEDELAYCERTGLAFIPWNPINAGNLEIRDSLKQIAKRHNATENQIALSWLLHKSPNILLIPGTSKVAHLEENVKAAAIELMPEEVEELEG